MSTYASVQAGIGILFGAVLFFVGRMVARRQVASAYAWPQRMFVTWWTAIGAAWVVWAVDTLLVQGITSTARALAVADYLLIVLYLALALLAFASLFHYLLFLYFGHVRLSGGVWILYGVLTAFVAALFVVANDFASFEATGITDAVFGDYQAIADGLRVAILLPVLLASLALFTVVRKVEAPLQRYRTLMLSASLAFYLLIPLLFPSNPGIPPEGAAGWAREILNKIGLVVAVSAAVLTYHPPAWVLRRYGEGTWA